MKRATSTALAVFLALVLVPIPAGAVSGFGDVAIDAFYTDAVQWMVDNNITTGKTATCFAPGDPVTRGQAAAFMWRMEGSPTGSPAHAFTDVTAAWQQDPVAWMAANQITTGTSATTFSPEKVVTRGELAAFLHRLAGSPEAPPPTQFTDVVAEWQITPVGWMVQNQITTGTTATTFSPDASVTRGQIAAFLYRYKGEPPVTIDRIHPTSPVCSDQVPPPPQTPAEQRASFLAERQAAGWVTYVDPVVGWSIMHPSDWEILIQSQGQLYLLSPDGGIFFVSPSLDAFQDQGSYDYLRKVVENRVADGLLIAPDYSADLFSIDVDFDGNSGLHDVWGYHTFFAVNPITGDPIPEGSVAPTWWYGYYDPAAVPDYGYILETIGVNPLLMQHATTIVRTFTPAAGYP